MINAPKGTKDLLPEESYKWQYVEDIARKTAGLFGANEIRTPTFEHTEVFSRGVGEGTDIVNKEMYTFLDKGGRSITLKPEGTAGVARAFNENGLFNSALPQKLFYITQCFRYERPQAGRLREFHQFGIEFIGSKTADIDAEAIVLAHTFFSALSVTGLTLYINSIGCKNCRGAYEKALKEYLRENIKDLCPLCETRFEKNPLRILDCKNEQCKKITANAPQILDYICDDCKEHFETLKRLLDVAKVPYKINPFIVRGLDYYTKTVFEFVSDNVGAQGTICGGGRYDGLVEQLGGASTPGIGFAMGIERLMLLLNNLNVQIPNNNRIKLYIAPFGDENAYNVAFNIAMALRQKGVVTEIDHMNRGIKAQFKYADKIGAEYVLVLGGNEIDSGVAKIKRMIDGEEITLSLNEVVNYFN